MNDLEDDLRTLFTTKSAKMRTVIVPPARVLRRGRRRQIATATAGAVLAAGVVAITLLGLTTWHSSVPATVTPPAQRTSTIAAITLSYPASWTLEDLWMSEAPSRGPRPEGDPCSRSRHRGARWGPPAAAVISRAQPWSCP